MSTQERVNKLKVKSALKSAWLALKQAVTRYDVQITSYIRLIGGTVEFAISGFCILMEISFVPIVSAQIRTTPVPAVTEDPLGLIFYAWPLVSVFLTITVWIAVMAHGLFMLSKSLSVFDYHDKRLYELVGFIEAVYKRLLKHHRAFWVRWYKADELGKEDLVAQLSIFHSRKAIISPGLLNLYFEELANYLEEKVKREKLMSTRVDKISPDDNN